MFGVMPAQSASQISTVVPAQAGTHTAESLGGIR